jgi:nucleoside phosphorylase/CheY-like chemotaxis protein
MKILIIDDQHDNKVQDIVSQLRANNSVTVEHVMYTKEAYDKMLSTKYDLVLLDLQLRETIADDISIEAGVNLLELIIQDDSVIQPRKIVGITSHIEAYEKNLTSFQKHGYTLHLFDGEVEFIKDILDDIKIGESHIERYDVAIITALRHIEFEALLKNGLKWQELNYVDCNKYYRTSFIDHKGVERSVIATFCPRMGMPVSSAITMKVINKFAPSLIVMTGIAAGIIGRAELGDILAADLVWDWGSGKLQDDETDVYLHADPEPISIEPSIAIELKDIAQKRLYVDSIKDKWQGDTPPNSLNMKVGAIASGSAVLADSSTVKVIKGQKRSVIGVEMEAFGVLTAASLSGVNVPKILILKSVCDFANSDKNDQWQRYAAYTSCSMAFEIMKSHISFPNT